MAVYEVVYQFGVMITMNKAIIIMFYFEHIEMVHSKVEILYKHSI